MICIGTIVNIITILAGGAAGLLLKKVLSERITDTVMQGVGLAVIIIGIGGALNASFSVSVTDGVIESRYILFMIISLAVGGLVGEVVNIERLLDRLAGICKAKFAKSDDNTFVQGFIAATLVFCVGSMAIVGAMEDGINRNPDVLFAKSALDGITAMIFASTMGVGVLFSAVAVGLYQGGLTLLSVLISPYLSDTVVTQMSLIGSVLILGIGLNLLGIAKIKVGNLLPAVFVSVAVHLFWLVVGNI
ncbi:MAG: DUF554 domain-containing protein [Oscillospiraceae bacterium]|nr:DUF554 domain-containing protein [Oscillospiraceae bacterium]